MSRNTQLEFTGSLLEAAEALIAIEEQTDMVLDFAELKNPLTEEEYLYVKLKTSR